MKKLFLPALFLSTLISQNALAMHAYRSEDCQSQTHNLNYLGNYSYGGMYKMALVNDTEGVTALPLDNGEKPSTLEDAEIIFSEIDSKVTVPEVITSDCGFEHSEWTTEKTIEVNLISTEASSKMSLKSGEKITFICKETTDFPNGTECN
jgi:hypothetical protein